jgi:7-carboxy-7-deazaguanine synthase
MRIAEVFSSIQGEGVLAGMPSVFIRASGCNLRCAWCDTPYASWQPEGAERTVVELLEAATLRHVVLTGGEPLLFPEVVELCAQLRAAGHHVTIETAGTLWQPVVCDLLSLSPKLRNSTPAGEWAERHEERRLRPQVMRPLMAASVDYQLKFVVARPEDLTEIEPLVKELEAPPERVLLMPEGTTPEVLAERSLWLVDECLRRGYRYSPRLHVQIWGNRRGV